LGPKAVGPVTTVQREKNVSRRAASELHGFDHAAELCNGHRAAAGCRS
jgi:hypothetical protein